MSTTPQIGNLTKEKVGLAQLAKLKAKPKHLPKK